MDRGAQGRAGETGCSVMKSFSQRMIEAVNRAIDAGVFYQDDFVQFVLEAMGGADCAPVLVADIKVADSPEAFQRNREARLALEAKISALPRGSYALLRAIGANQREFISTFVSDGSGELGIGKSFEVVNTVPTGSEIVASMMRHEIFLCRKRVEEERAIAADRQAVIEHGLHVGAEYKTRLQISAKTFTGVVIDAIEDGTLQLKLRMRGSSKRWTTKMGAVSFLHGLARGEAMMSAEERAAEVRTTPAPDDAAQEASLFTFGR